jgi:hypothetical protein
MAHWLGDDKLAGSPEDIVRQLSDILGHERLERLWILAPRQPVTLQRDLAFIATRKRKTRKDKSLHQRTGQSDPSPSPKIGDCV